MSNCESDSESDIEVDEGSQEIYRCLVCENETPEVSAFFEHISTVHGCDLRQEKRLFADQYVWITFVNWARSNSSIDTNAFLSLDDENRNANLQPILEDDTVLMIDVESFNDTTASGDRNESKSFERLKVENEELRAQLAKCRQFIAGLADERIECTDSEDEVEDKPPMRPAGYRVNNPSLSCLPKSTSLLLSKIELDAFGVFFKSGSVKNRTVLNLFNDSGLFSVLALQNGAEKVYIPPKNSNFECAKQLAESNKCRSKLEAYSDSPFDVLLWDWLSVFLANQDAGHIFRLIQSSKCSHIFPRLASLRVVGVCLDSPVLRRLIPASNVCGIDVSSLVNLAYHSVYTSNWSAYDITEVTDVQTITSIDATTAENFLFDEAHLSLTLNCTAKVNGLLFYLEYDIDGSGHKFSTKTSSVFGQQSLVVLRDSIDAYSGQKISGSIARNSLSALHIKLNNPNGPSKTDADFVLPV